MPHSPSFITATDGFCGAGGSSQGARAAGVEVAMALNHWPLAIETHNTNFPETRHDCTDISACDPRRYPTTTIAIFSPECTTHSPAGGNNHKMLKKQMDLFVTGKVDPATERSRATMWDVCRFTEYHLYENVIVENVVEALTRWALFDVWLSAMHKLGYNHRLCFLNSMHTHPTPQSRDRMYIVFWKKGNKAPMLDYTPAAWCSKCCKDVAAVQTFKKYNVRYGKYRQQYVYCCPYDGGVIEPYYYAALNCVDWSDLGQRIGDRKKPLVKPTMDRIQYGLNKHGNQLLTITTRYSSGLECRVKLTANEVLPTQPGDAAHGIVTPFIIRQEHTNGVASGKVKTVAQSYSTQTCTNTSGLVVPYIVRNQTPGNCKPSTGSIGTITTDDTHSLLTPPIITELRGFSKARPATRELNGVTAGGIHSGLVTTESFSSFLSSYYGGSQVTSEIVDVAGTITTNERHAIVNYQQPRIEDCFYRMLKPKEIKLAMAFENDYIVLGNAKEQVKQLGNAVTPPAMEWLVKQVVESLQ